LKKIYQDGGHEGSMTHIVLYTALKMEILR